VSDTPAPAGRDWRTAIVAPVAAGLIRGLYATLRVRHVHAENIETLNAAGRQYIIAFWHSDIMMMLHSRFRRPIMVMSSQHRDSELIVGAYRLYGVQTARGSSTRGGMAVMRAFIRAARAGSNLVFTPDGPKGPRHEAKPGVVFCAQATGLPILPIAFTARRQKTLRSWDGWKVPRPLSRALFLYGQPIEVPRELTEEQIEEYRLRVEQTLNEMAERVEGEFEELWKEGR
jgi:lysophospholipid acyltransferase (LPLAT)-like uncharacterized protein